jgi:hypothetical protein
MRPPNHAASGNGAVASLFHIGRLGRAVPEPRRSANIMRALLLFLVSFTVSASCLAGGTNSVKESRAMLLIHGTDKIQNEASALSAAISYGRSSAKATLYGEVTSLTKSPVTVKDKLQRGDTIWTVEVMNAAANEIFPIPEGIYWVCAKNGKVVEVGPR